MKFSKPLFLAVLFLILSQSILWAALRHEKKDKNGDGKTDQWLTYSSNNKLLQKTTDTNGDGKPDQFHTPLSGSREFVLKEYDRNFDGKIDKRALTRWDGDKTIPIVMGNSVRRSPNPGYVTIWKEEDDDFDGVIDKYYMKKDKTKKEQPAEAKVGQPITTSPTPVREPESTEKLAEKTGPAATEDESRIQGMNERHGF